MGYFAFVMSEVHGLRIKELLDEKAAGRKIIGSYCVFVPEEIVLAANATLVGLCTEGAARFGTISKRPFSGDAPTVWKARVPVTGRSLCKIPVHCATRRVCCRQSAVC